MSRGEPFAVQLEVFHGPLDLLLTLIRREALDITTVALRQVTGQYLAYMARLEEIDSGALASFCEVASTLLLIKSRALLPAPARPATEVDEDVDATELVERLRAYRQVHRVAEELARRERAGLRVYSRVASPPELVPALPPGEVSVDALVAALEATLAQIGPPSEALSDPALQPHVIQLGDRLVELRELILERGRITFRQALGDGQRDREFIIVSFLAVLELLRLGWLRAIQDDLFAEIALELHPDAPVAKPETATRGIDRAGHRPGGGSALRALALAVTCGLLASTVCQAQGRRPFGLPFREPPGLGTWYISHLYGNTIFAYYERRDMYRSGQGMHMGLDFAAPCGTAVRAIGDGVVRSVDGPGGAGPHNLMVDHRNGYVSFYGHLLTRPSVAPGQAVAAGEAIALSGDMLGTCIDSPHLHLEIRDTAARVFYNPISLIEADWHGILLLGPGTATFAIDLDHPRRWRAIDDQPSLRLGGPLLNDYANSWPSDDR